MIRVQFGQKFKLMSIEHLAFQATSASEHPALDNRVYLPLYDLTHNVIDLVNIAALIQLDP